MRFVDNCFVCGGSMRDVPIAEQLTARRAMNVAVIFCRPGENGRYPKGLARHSYCEPGTERWARHMDRKDPRDRAWLQRFGFDPDQVPVEGEIMSKKSISAKREKRAIHDKRLPKVGSEFSREYKGKAIKVRVTEAGLVWDGKTFGSLSALAKAVTKYPSISGYQFFEDALAGKLAAKKAPTPKKSKAAAPKLETEKSA